MPNNVPFKKKQRAKIRSKRVSLSKHEKKVAGQQLYKQIVASPEFLRSQHIAFYLANDGEIDPTLIIQKAWSMGKACYLPVLNPLSYSSLSFVKYTADTYWRKNRFNIPEPDLIRQHIRQPWALDLVFTPLVGFDNKGHRLGMGGGFYDRTFAFKLMSKCRKPLLVGLAYDFQKLDTLQTDAWDIRLEKVATEKAFYTF